MDDYKCWIKVFKALNENEKRWLAAEKALQLGRGGIAFIKEITGLSRTTIAKGIKELSELKNLPLDRVRQEGGGRKSITSTNKKVINAIEKIVGKNTAGDPMSALKWTSKTCRNIADELKKKGLSVSHMTVFNILRKLDYSLQSNKKVITTKQDPNRDSQFKYINKVVSRFLKENEPVISVDTKKKELIGKFKNNGRAWKKKGEAEAVYDHDFKSLSDGVAIPYGTYDIKENEGFVNVGVSSDTAEFAVNSIYQWWRVFGIKKYPNATELLICADGGGSNGSRNKLWKAQLQELSKKIKVDITVCHYPPGTSKWNKIEHKMFSFISLNWKGVPLENYETVIKFIGNTKTKSGLKMKARLDRKDYKKGEKVLDDDFERLNLTYHKKYPKWNYTIKQE